MTTRISRLLPFVAACALLVCAASTVEAQRRSGIEPIPVLEPVHPGTPRLDVSGTWVTGSSGEPAGREVTMQGECNATPALWLLEQNGSAVRLYTFAPFHAQGIPSSPVSSVVAEGRVSGRTITMSGTDARFALHYHRRSGHLRGTLNGKPFWAMRLQIVQPENCIAIP